METYNLTTQQVVQPQLVNTTFQLVYLALDWFAATILIRLRDQNNIISEFRYGGPTGTDADRTKALTLMSQLNTANLSTASLQKRVLLQLQSDGLIPGGAVTGTPA